MKKLLLCFIIICFFNAATAQTAWCPPGAKWNFKRGSSVSNSGINGDVELAYTSDTTVLGIPCKKLKATFMGQTSGPMSPVVTQNFNTYYTYKNNGVIFLYNGSNNRFDTVVNFNALIGDKWLRPGTDPQPNGCNSRRAFTVTDTAQVNVNGFNLKKITTTYTSSVNYGQGPLTLTHVNVFVERILFFSSPGYYNYNLFPTYCEVDNMIAEIPYTSLSCYEDNTFPLYNTSASSQCRGFWTGIKTITGNNVGVKAYPNPADDILTIEIPEADRYLVKVSDLLGTDLQVNASIVNEATLSVDLTRLNTGIYFLQVYSAGNVVGIKKLIKN